MPRVRFSRIDADSPPGHNIFGHARIPHPVMSDEILELKEPGTQRQ